MNIRPTLHDIEPIDPVARAQSPNVFVRTFTAPPGLPWDQSRVAAMEARAGAPLPLTEVVYQLRRLDPWVFGRAARYAAFYVRTQDSVGNFQRTVDVNGRPIRVHFMSTKERNRRARGLAVLGAVTAGLAVVVSGAISSALTTRADTAQRLDALEQITAARVRAANVLERQRHDGSALDSAGVRRLGLNSVLEDLMWASNAKTPNAHIDALHWDHGHIAVEVRGDAPPFLSGSRAVMKADKPLRPRVWLWGVEPASVPMTSP